MDANRLNLPIKNISASDGLATRTPGVGVFLPLADCPGVVIYDPHQRILMVVHAGRHNLEQDGLVKAVEFLTGLGSQPRDLTAWISPTAGAENYPVEAFGGQGLLQIATNQLAKAGVSKIAYDETDTTTSEKYYSHSQGDHDKRFAIVAYIK